MCEQCDRAMMSDYAPDISIACEMAHAERVVRENWVQASIVSRPNDRLPEIVTEAHSIKVKSSDEPETQPEDEESLCSLCDVIEDDCSCWFCDGCERKRLADSTKCSNCGNCESCCECLYCELCESYYGSDDRWCSECDRCGDCCNCESGEDEGPRHEQEFKIERPSNLLGYSENKLRRPVSVELELSEVSDCAGKLYSWAKKTGAGLVQDGSVEGLCTCEVNANPASGDIFLTRMRELSSIVKNAESNYRCGMHVHIDASDYSQFDLRRLIMLWAGVESTMYERAICSRLACKRDGH